MYQINDYEGLFPGEEEAEFLATNTPPGEVYWPEQFEWPFHADLLQGKNGAEFACNSNKLKLKMFLPNGTFHDGSRDREPAPLDILYYCKGDAIQDVKGRVIHFGFAHPAKPNVWMGLYSYEGQWYTAGARDPFFPEYTMAPGWQKKYAKYKVPPMPKEMLSNIQIL